MRVLVVGTNRMCHERLAARGHELVLLIPRGKARPGDPAGPYEHVVILDDATPTGVWVEVARVLHQAGEPFAAVAAYNEHTYPVVAAVAKELGVPTVVDLELFERVLDKSRVREVLDRHAIPSCRYRLAAGREEIAAAVEEIGPPCIVKPVDGEASAGVSRIDTPADVDAALTRLGPAHAGRPVLVEEFLTGQEYSVEGISTPSGHHIVAVTKKYTDPATFVEQGHMVPAPLDTAAHQEIAAYTERVLDALGFHDCPSHTELVLTPAGPRLIETHNRIGGDNIMDLVHLATGVDMYDLVARQSLGEDVTPLLPHPIRATRTAVAWYAAPTGPASNVLLEVRNLDRVRALPQVARAELLKPPGSRQTQVTQSTDRSAYVLTLGPTPHQTLTAAQEAVAALDFVYVWRPQNAPPTAD
jgi:biotin carboxylase